MAIVISNDISVEVDLIARRGDSYDREFVVKDSTSASYNFAGYSAKMQIKINQNDAASVLELTSTSGISLSTGLLVISISKTTLKDILPRNYYYDLEITYPTTKVKTWLRGKFSINQDVTR